MFSGLFIHYLSSFPFFHFPALPELILHLHQFIHPSIHSPTHPSIHPPILLPIHLHFLCFFSLLSLCMIVLIHSFTFFDKPKLMSSFHFMLYFFFFLHEFIHMFTFLLDASLPIYPYTHNLCDHPLFCLLLPMYLSVHLAVYIPVSSIWLSVNSLINPLMNPCMQYLSIC